VHNISKIVAEHILQTRVFVLFEPTGD